MARPTATDDDLAAAARGDEQAFAAVYLEIQPRLRRYATSLVGQDADDVTAEAWLQIVRDLQGFTGALAEFRAWTARIVRNRAMDHLRSTARRPAESLGPQHLATLTAPGDAESAALTRLTTVDAIALISTLPPDQAEAIMLRTVVGLDARAAGSILGKSAGAVRVLTHRGLQSLGRTLRARDGGAR